MKARQHPRSVVNAAEWLRCPLGDGQDAVVVAMFAMRMVQVASDKIVRVTTVRHRFMATGVAVLMIDSVVTTGMIGRAGIGVR